MRNVSLVGREEDESKFHKCHKSVHTAKLAAENELPSPQTAGWDPIPRHWKDGPEKHL